MSAPKAFRPKKTKSWTEYILEEYLWLFTIFLVPLSIIIDLFSYVHLRFSYLFFSSSGRHEDRVKQVQKQVRDWIDSGSKVIQ